MIDPDFTLTYDGIPSADDLATLDLAKAEFAAEFTEGGEHKAAVDAAKREVWGAINRAREIGEARRREQDRFADAIERAAHRIQTEREGALLLDVARAVLGDDEGDLL